MAQSIETVEALIDRCLVECRVRTVAVYDVTSTDRGGTAKDHKVYAILFEVDGDGGTVLRGPVPRQQSEVRLLGRGKEVACSPVDGGLHVALPPDARSALTEGLPVVLRFNILE